MSLDSGFPSHSVSSGLFCTELEQFHPQICLVDVILLNPQVSFRGFEITMVIDQHDEDGRELVVYTGVITPCFPQAVAGYFPGNPQRRHRRMDDPPCLHPADGFIFLAVAGKDKLAFAVWV